MVRRRRQRKFTWMPGIGSVGSNAAVDNSVIFLNSLTVAPNPAASVGTRGGPITSFFVPLIQDKPLEPQLQNEVAGSLNNVTGNEWFCERIVGDIFAGVRLGIEQDGGPRTVAFTVGIFVARADNVTGNLPVGALQNTSANSETALSYAPLALNTIREPWMFRRTWVLGRSFDGTDGLAQNPSVNSFYSTMHNGPHIDVKSVRRIGNDERLWLVTNTQDWSINGPNPTEPGLVDVAIDVRVLGALRRPKNRSAF